MTEPRFETVLYERDGAVAILTLNRPEALNALSVQLRAELAAALRMAEDDDEVRAIVLTGAGERSFSVGLDLKELTADPSKLRSATHGQPADSPSKALEDCTCPIICAVNGFAITGGFELALACDVLIASENASFGDTHAKVGAMPGWGLSQRLSRIIGPSRAKEMHFGCQRIDAATANAWGLVSRVVPLADLRRQAVEMAHTFSAHDPKIIAEMKRVVDRGYALPFGDGMELEGAAARDWNSSATPVDVSKTGR
ncbi:enoyl-CoA hydratase [Thalassobius vesicularis]|uniref:Enoyl-CoA hydratase n=1 Tax=Thalassobius vesicularis TaxID=1294297 RepID=A0A4S3MDJ0_9RHOB|nr:enoyl-CoA hydratase [Thalassobius vesicularis]THD76547.1 enoyl-CoA hydratase [Thalassobius vesicularis]